MAGEDVEAGDLRLPEVGICGQLITLKVVVIVRKNKPVRTLTLHSTEGRNIGSLCYPSL